MNKWHWLLFAFVCSIGAGFALFRVPAGQVHGTDSLSVSAGRIVSFAPNLTEILFALGLADEIVGVPIDSDYPAAAKEKPKIGTYWQPSIEAVIDIRPDLVVTLWFAQQESIARRLERMGYKTLTLKMETVAEFFAAVEEIGAATGRQKRAEKLISDMKQEFDRLEGLVRGRKKVKVLWVVQREPLRVAGTDTFVNELIELAGGENAIGATVHKYPPIGAEQVIACGTEVIIEPAMANDDLVGQRRQALAYWGRFENVPAVRQGRIYVVDGDTVSQLGPRLIAGIETIGRCLRPELFGN